MGRTKLGNQFFDNNVKSSYCNEVALSNKNDYN